jgi:hypothetical protein
MITVVAASLVFATLFVAFALLGTRQNQAGCHGCAGADEHPECGSECPLLEDAERRRWETNV